MAFRLKWYGDRVAAKVITSAARRTQAMAEELAGMVRDECPVDSGRLKESVRVEPVEGKGGIVATVKVGEMEVRGEYVDYQKMVHDGTRRTPANAFFSRAVSKFRNKRR